MENVMVGGNNFVQIPLDLVIEIFGRLPVKSVARFLAVSKSFARFIRSKDFMASFPYRSFSFSYQPRVLIAFIDIDRQNSFCQKWYLFSLSPSSSTSFVSCVTFPLPNPAKSEYKAHYVNGLISVGFGRKQHFITNPSVGKSTHLPRVEIPTNALFTMETVRSFFGYDSVNDDYKVLCMSENMLMDGRHLKSSHHQVHTLGGKQEPWRKIKCSFPHHRSFSNGHVCIDGVVYYLAYTGAGLSQLCLMRFDLKFETLDLFTILPPGIGSLEIVTLINYKGKVALPVKTSSYTYEVWIVDQDSETHVLSKKNFSIRPWKDLFKVSLDITGTTRTGEFILAPMHFCEEFSVLYYNPDTNYFCDCSLNENKDYEVEENEVYEFHVGTRTIVFPDYVESVRLL